MARILVVDDDTLVRKMIVRVLTTAGFEAEGAAGGDEALQLSRKRSFDLVILDVVMPEKGGIETVMELRQHNPKQRTIIMSGKVPVDSTTFRMLAERFGASDILEKPFKSKDILEAVNAALHPA